MLALVRPLPLMSKGESDMVFEWCQKKNGESDLVKMGRVTWCHKVTWWYCILNVPIYCGISVVVTKHHCGCHQVQRGRLLEI